MNSHVRRNGKILAILMLDVSVSGATAIAPTATVQDVVAVARPAPVRSEATVLVEKRPNAGARNVLPVRAAHTGNTANLFAGHSWYTPPPVPAHKGAPVRREPVAPPLPYKLIGTYEQGDDDILYFLVKGDRVYDVAIGDTLDGSYTVDGEMNGQLMFTYLPLNTSQGLRLGEQ